MNWWRTITIGLSIAKNYKQLIPEIKELYAAYVDAKADKKLTLDETRRILDELFDVLALAIPAVKQLRLMKDSEAKK